MMQVWSHRPQLLHWGLFVTAYLLGCGFATALAIVPGITVSIWPPGGVFMATLILTNPYSWPWWILGGCLAESFGQLVWFKSGLPLGWLIFAGNAVEAVVGASLINWFCGRRVRLETLREVLAFVVLGAGIAPSPAPRLAVRRWRYLVSNRNPSRRSGRSSTLATRRESCWSRRWHWSSSSAGTARPGSPPRSG